MGINQYNWSYFSKEVLRERPEAEYGTLLFVRGCRLIGRSLKVDPLVIEVDPLGSRGFMTAP
jgi:hypothetical protein